MVVYKVEYKNGKYILCLLVGECFKLYCCDVLLVNDIIILVIFQIRSFRLKFKFKSVNFVFFVFQIKGESVGVDNVWCYFGD